MDCIKNTYTINFSINSLGFSMLLRFMFRLEYTMTVVIKPMNSEKRAIVRENSKAPLTTVNTIPDKTRHIVHNIN